MNVTSVLQRIAAQAETVDGLHVAPGGLRLQLPGRGLRQLHDGHQRPRAAGLLGAGRQAARRSAGRDRAAADDQVSGHPRPVRSIAGGCSGRWRRCKAWIPVDGYYDMGPGPRQSPDQQEQAYPLSECMSCGCCLDACPQYSHVEVVQAAGETDAAVQDRARTRRTT